MNEVKLEEKTEELAISKAKEQLNASDNEIIYKIEEIKGGLLKGTKYSITATTLTHIIDFMKKFIEENAKYLEVSINMESNIRDKVININIYSDKNAILIGKDGKNLKALETLCKSYIFSKYDFYPTLNLDIENYKEKRIKHLEHLALKTAREVRKTKIEASLEDMNSYERRIVHNVLSNFKGVETTSTGEEPNRYIVIKPKEDK